MDISIATNSFPANGIRRMFEKAALCDDVVNMSLGEHGFITLIIT